MKETILQFGIGFVMACAVTSLAAAQPDLKNEAGKIAQPIKEANVNQTTTETKEAKEKAPTAAKPGLAGKVVETMNSGGYTYILVEKDGKRDWAAVPATQVSVGQDVQVRTGIEMGKFSSKSLNKTFENILFSPGLVTETATNTPEGQLQLPPGHPPQGGMAKDVAAMPGSGGGTGMAGTLIGKVVETMNSGGYTYISLEKEGKKTWVAVPTMKVAVGEKLELQMGAEMSNFSSKTLNKTFEKVIFSEGPVKK